MHKSILFRIVVLLFVLATLIYLGVMAYLGTFTRYMADDYCETYFTQTYSPLGAVINRYEEGQWRAANRYSNLLFVGIVETLFGKEKYRDRPCDIDVSMGTKFGSSGAAGTHIGGDPMAHIHGCFFWNHTGFLFHSGSTQSLSNILLAFQHGNPLCTFDLS